MRAIIFGAGVYDFQFPSIREDDVIIAADGGYRVCREKGIEPHRVIGDFDSLGYVPGSALVEKLPVEKDITDLHAAVNIARKLGCTEVHIYGGMGGRPDHTLANITILARLSKSGTGAFMYGDGYMLTAVTDGSIRLSGERGKTVSVFSFSEKSEGITLDGLKYPLVNGTLENDFSLGVSNSFEEVFAGVEVKKGTLIIAVQQ